MILFDTMKMNKSLYVVSLDVLPYTVTTDIWQEWHGSLVKHQMSTTGLHHVNVAHCMHYVRLQHDGKLMLKESSVHVHADMSQRVIYAKKRARACGQVCIAHMHACKLHRWINN